LARVPEVEARAEADFEAIFGRRYRPVMGYRTEDADILLIASATSAPTARVAVDAARARGERVGVVRIRRFRPFPAAPLRELVAASGASKLAVLDRNISMGSEGIFCTEIKAALYGGPVAPAVHGFIAGLGGDDITPDTIARILDRTRAADAPPPEPTWIGVLPEEESR
jgi:pyruvate/2-oxoacid:ferredoxin oxidoreductase alpha subunit